MTLTAHVAVGSAIGLATRNPILGFFVGFLLHHLMDVIPHTDIGSAGGDLKTFRKVKYWQLIISGDILLGLSLFIFIFYRSNYLPAVFWGMVGCVISDVIDNVPFWSPTLQKFFLFKYFHKFHDLFHITVKNKKYLWVGVATQVIAIVVSLTYVLVV